jgi:hypothetical protein
VTISRRLPDISCSLFVPRKTAMLPAGLSSGLGVRPGDVMFSACVAAFASPPM